MAQGVQGNILSSSNVTECIIIQMCAADVVVLIISSMLAPVVVLYHLI